jgi:preprotein translocase subunit SecF
VNDTVVVFDRIRENFRKMRKGSPIEIINTSINQTLSRTIITSGVTLLVVIALLILGGPVLHGFSLALFVGIIVGTYSSIYIASATALMLGLNKADLMIRRKEDQPVDDMP